MSPTVHVSNIGPSTSEKELKDFFSYCGKIVDLSITPTSDTPDATKSATVTFEREAAAHTALLLNQTQLSGHNIRVESSQSLDEMAGGKAASHADEPDFGADTDPVARQENKPRSAIFAEMLAQGYVIGDQALTKGIELDKKHGITAKFTAYLAAINEKLHATDRARSTDQTYHVTEKVKSFSTTMGRYFEKALDNPTGQKIRKFYADAEKEVLDIHGEARRLADLKQQQSQKGENDGVFTEPKETTCPCGGNDSACQCDPAKCACTGCSKKTKSTEPGSGELSGAYKDISNTAGDISVGQQQNQKF